MKQFIQEFGKRGLTASVFGPIVVAIVYGCLGASGAVTSFTPGQVCLVIPTSALMAFIAAGVTAVYQMEQLPLFAATLIHGGALYADYILIYLLNGWLRSQLTPILIFTVCFIAGYAVIWLIIYAVTKRSAARLNRKLRES